MEKYEVFIKSEAKEDLREIFRYITEVLYEPAIAERICDAIETAILSLMQFPLRHSVIIEEPFALREIRRMHVKNYTIFYVVENAEKKVHVLRVLYSRRNWQDLV